jgi:transposase
VINMEDQITIKNIKAKNPGKSLRSLGKLLGISHNTVKAALEREGPPEYQRESKQNPELEKYHDLIFEMANIKKFVGSRILSEIIRLGYKGSRSPFYNYLKGIKIKEQKTFTPYETAPAEQSQFDWSPYTVTIGKELVQIYIYSYINSFSRYQVYEFSLTQDQSSIFEALENSFIESSGLPERLQTDNAKAFVQNASKNNFQWNKHYLHFLSHYGVNPSRSIPRHPWSKGKVEKPFQYIENHFIAGSVFESYLDLQRKLKEFQDHVNQREHSTINTKPALLFEEEKRSLKALPERRFIGFKQEVRKLNSNCFISYNGSRYSAPYIYSGKLVWIKVSRGYCLQIYSNGHKMIAEHPISLQKRKIIYKEEHFRGYKTEFPNYEHLSTMFIDKFPGYELFTEKLYAQKRHNPRYHLAKILDLARLYSKEDFIRGLDTCLKYNMFNYTLLSGYLEKNHKHKIEINQNSLIDVPRDNIIRNMQEYSLTHQIQKES